ncbi:MAG: hypothetical protein HN531_16655 [Opitutae bacterium]|jgi:hypothetical protein|nr:hypothetical protein [Opitutae bacterium]
MKFIPPCLALAPILAIQALACPPKEGNDSTSPPPPASNPDEISATLTEQEKEHPFNLLVFGGGYSPSGNQVSLESNVKYFRRIRSSMGLGEAAMKTYFADGKSKDRDLQFFDPSFRIPEANQIMAELLGSSRGIANQYRNNDLQADDSSSLGALDKWVSMRAKQGGEQTNLIYFTGHGGKADKKTPHNTTAYLWNNSRLKVSELVRKLDKLPKEQPCIFVMVQCYSGGFANIIFKEGNPKKGLSEYPRAGFFATVKDRVAAGCTPDIREKNYHEYSTRFWEGLCGESRVGKKTKQPDLNKDGKTSLAEAHAYVILRSDTIDIPIKTSDVFLRHFSALAPPNPPAKTDSNKTSSIGSKISAIIEKLPNKKSAETNRQSNACDPNDLFCSVSDPLKDLLKGTEKKSKFVINGLSRRLELTLPNRHDETKKLIESLKKKRSTLSEQKKKHDEERGKIKKALALKLRKTWPELRNLHHPTVISLYRKPNADDVQKVVDTNGSWARYKELSAKSKQLEAERFLLEKKEVLGMRLIRELETIVLVKNLPLINPPHVIGSYEKLKDLENAILPEPAPIAKN